MRDETHGRIGFPVLRPRLIPYRQASMRPRGAFMRGHAAAAQFIPHLAAPEYRPRVHRVAAALLLLALSRAAAPAIALPQHAPLRFIVTGDAGATHSALRDGMLAVARRTRIDGILLVGDNFYPCGVSGLGDPQWTKITAHFGPTHLPIYPVLGNHDYGDQQERGGKNYWTCGHPDAGAE